MPGLVPDLLPHKAGPNVTETATNHSDFQREGTALTR
jgi:hypothetical protein